MDLSDTPQEAEFRLAARQWIAGNAPHHLADHLKRATFGVIHTGPFDPFVECRKWMMKKAAANWACIPWPTEYGGRGGKPIESVIWRQEEGVYGKLGDLFIIQHGMIGPTIMECGTPAQRERYMRPLASGEEFWCQLFSEPAAGSDLAGLRTRAERKSDGWQVNGQKVWTSGAQYADFGLLLARTDASLPKHRGLTMFLIDMKSKGIDVRPIKQANGGAHFNEVFFEDVHIPDEARLGEVNDGWRVALTTLMNERYAVAGIMDTGLGPLRHLVRSLKVHGLRAIDDSAVRSRIADWHVRTNGVYFTGVRTTSALSRGDTPGPENSIGKLVAAGVFQEVSVYGMELLGLRGLIADSAHAFDDGRIQAMFLRSPATHIEGGSDQILRNIIAERVLGLPSDVRLDKEMPFNATGELQSSGRK